MSKEQTTKLPSEDFVAGFLSGVGSLWVVIVLGWIVYHV